MPEQPATKPLRAKLARIRSGRYAPADFIIADAKDADMAFAIPGMGPRSDGSPRARAEFLESIRNICSTGVIDVMLTSASNGELLAGEGLFEKTSPTLAVRGNDTTDIWRVRGANYHAVPSRPFRSANLAHTSKFCGLTLYSMTFNNDLDADYASLEEFARYRQDCIDAGTD